MGQYFLEMVIICKLLLSSAFGLSEEINPELKPLLEKLDLDEKYHGLANEIFNKAERSMSQDNNPLKHLEGLNTSVRRLLKSIPGPRKIEGTEVEALGKKILNFANEEFEKYFVAEPDLRANFNMSDEDIMKFKRVYDNTKSCVEELNVLFNCA